MTSSFLRVPTLKAMVASVALACCGTAAMAQSAASFQITSFSYVVSGGTLNWTDGSAYQTLYAESGEAGGLLGNQIDDATTYVFGNASATTSVAHATANASTSLSQTLAGSATATSSLVSPESQPHYGVSRASQASEFTLSQAGTVTFTLGYTLNTSSAGNNDDTYGQAALSFAAGTYAVTGDEQRVEYFSFDQPGSHSGTLTVTVSLAGPGDIGYYDLRGNAYAYATATAAVPEPGEWALMLAGLGVLGGWSRMRRQRA